MICAECRAVNRGRGLRSVATLVLAALCGNDQLEKTLELLQPVGYEQSRKFRVVRSGGIPLVTHITDEACDNLSNE